MRKITTLLLFTIITSPSFGNTSSPAEAVTEHIIVHKGIYYPEYAIQGKYFDNLISNWLEQAFDPSDPEAIRAAIALLSSLRGNPELYAQYIETLNESYRRNPEMGAEIQNALWTELMHTIDSSENIDANWSLVDFNGRDVSGKNLSGIPSLSGKQISRAANLRYADISGYTFSSKDMAYAWNDPTITLGIVTQNAVLNGRDLTGAIIRGADLSHGWRDGAGANFTNADLSGTKFEGEFDAGAYSNYTGANLTGASFAGYRGNGYASNFTGADLTGANFAGLSLYSYDSTGTAIGNYNAWSSNFTNANLKDADFTNNTMNWGNWTGVRSGGIKGGDKNLGNGWSVKSGYIVGPRVNLTNADLSGINLSGVNLSGVISANVTVSPTTVLPTGWSVVGGVLSGPPGTEPNPATPPSDDDWEQGTGDDE